MALFKNSKKNEGIIHNLASFKLSKGKDLPIRALFSGSPGSGKSSLIKRLTRRFAEDGITHYVVDNSGEALEYYRHFAPEGTKINVFSPKYSDGVGIDFASMITTASKRMEFGNRLIPQVKGDPHPFFNNMSRIVVEHVAEAFNILAKGKALLADIIRVACDSAIAKELSIQAGLGDPYERFAEESRSKSDTEVSIISILKPLAVFAALDYHCKERITLPVAERGSITIFEWSDNYSRALENIYPFLIDYIASNILDSPQEHHTALTVDEFRLLAPLECIHQLAARGRKQKTSLILSNHEVSGLYDRYGKDRAEELIGLMTHRCFLKVGSPISAEHAAKYLGSCEVLERIASSKHDGPESRSIKMRENVLPDEIRVTLPLPNWNKDQVTGFLDCPYGVYRFKSPFREDVIIDKGEPRELRPDDDQELPPFGLKDLKRLDITATKELLKAMGLD